MVSHQKNKTFLLSYLEKKKIVLFSQELSIPLIVQIKNATFQDYEKILKKLEVLEIGDPAKLVLIPANNMIGTISYKLYTKESASIFFPET